MSFSSLSLLHAPTKDKQGQNTKLKTFPKCPLNWDNVDPQHFPLRNGKRNLSSVPDFSKKWKRKRDFWDLLVSILQRRTKNWVYDFRNPVHPECFSSLPKAQVEEVTQFHILFSLLLRTVRIRAVKLKVYYRFLSSSLEKVEKYFDSKINCLEVNLV